MKYELVIESMHCEQCATNIERYLRNQSGVESAEVDFHFGIGQLEVDANTDIADLIEAINSMGYDASIDKS